jgi:hypothetical protein
MEVQQRGTSTTEQTSPNGKREVFLKKQVSSKDRYASTNNDSLHHKQSRKLRLALWRGK